MNARFDKLFREEAVRHHRAGQRASGDVLRLSPRWAAAASWSLYAALAGCTLFAALATVDEYVAGPAVVCGAVDGVDARVPRFSIVALMPGAARPDLRPGQRLRVTLAGYRDARIIAIVDEVAPSVIGPAEARRALGAHADLVPVAGAIAIVRAHLAADVPPAGGAALELFDGMSGTAQLRLARRSILAMLVPWLFDGRHHAG